jgi:hypothetical protein
LDHSTLEWKCASEDKRELHGSKKLGNLSVLFIEVDVNKHTYKMKDKKVKQFLSQGRTNEREENEWRG